MEKQPAFENTRLSPSEGIEYGRLLLEVPNDTINIPHHVALYALTNDYTPKDEYHLTVVGKKTQQILSEYGYLDDVVRLIDSEARWEIRSWSDIKVLQNVEIDDQGNEVVEESIIQLVSLPAMNKLYDKICAITHLAIETPPAHITLYTKNTARGIGIYSQSQLEEYTIATLDQFRL